MQFSKIFVDLTSIIFLIVSSIFLRFLLDFFKQKWIQSISQTTTIVILPVVTFIITKVISGNIALSLGMVGALSIVRFRNPVKSPLELTVYFYSIAMGIATAVSIKWLIFLNFAILLAIGSLYTTSIISKKLLKRNFFYSSFSEGNSMSSLEIQSRNNIKVIEDSKFLKSKYYSNDITKYILLAPNFEELKKISQLIIDDNRLIDFQLNE